MCMCQAQLTGLYNGRAVYNVTFRHRRCLLSIQRQRQGIAYAAVHHITKHAYVVAHGTLFGLDTRISVRRYAYTCTYKKRYVYEKSFPLGRSHSQPQRKTQSKLQK